uniref:Predicted nucleic acid-binding protein, contains PIN domain n=1 Tax=Candidatus Kentrum sp. LFY TaxID=2126342 RepID=A0A450WK47_9GAMM|nr:MAG: Predicted nucleic acid-binding protein, contains PIN domain [Candidatus Kentron sp. LFY]VFK17410.1 MAG: Predicted nucleic acid-binding protein, contains PIN domain [Candidatus Kentron sp. LFY]
MRLVIDASMALAWLFQREKAEQIVCAEHVLLSIVGAKSLVPSLWYTEVANALLVGERRLVVTRAQVVDYLGKLSRLPITMDDTLPAHRRDQVMALAREHELSAYDATYLELALRTDAVMATFDGKLMGAMRRAGGLVFCDIPEPDRYP